MEGYQLPVEERERRRLAPGHDSILYVNDYGLVDRKGNQKDRWVEKPAVGGFRFLEEVIANSDLLRMIVMTARQEEMEFWQPERNTNPLGFRLVRRDGEELTKDDKKEAAAIQSWLLSCGDEPDPIKRKRLRRDSFAGFMRKSIWDSLVYDACPVEVEGTFGGKPSGIYAVPATTIRLCTETGYEGHDEIQAVQVIDNNPYTAYTFDQLIYEVRNPRSDLRVNGYGYAEPEMFVRVLTAWINSFEYNRAGLDKNAIPRKILALFGDWEQRELNALSSRFSSQLTGAGNANKLPMIAIKSATGETKGMEVIDVDERPTELLMAKWFSLQASIGCAIYGMHPAQINMPAFDSSTSTPMSGSDTVQKLAYARDKGLLPRLGWRRDWLNTWLMPRLTKKFEIQLVGIEEEEPARRHERQMRSSTINEIRKVNGQEPHENKLMGDAPSDAAYMPLYMQGLAQQQSDDGEPSFDSWRTGGQDEPTAPSRPDENALVPRQRRPPKMGKSTSAWARGVRVEDGAQP
jgi:hypothetical protein